jgi:predicted nucleic acid-binding protein
VTRYLLDTNLYVRAVRDAEWAEMLSRFVAANLPFIHLHAVVAQELLAGAVDAQRLKQVEEKLIRPFEKRGRVVTPSFGAWKRAGEMMSRLLQRGRMSRGGFSRSFVNDCLLAASCREQGFVLITMNAQDFERLREVASFEAAEPWP